MADVQTTSSSSLLTQVMAAGRMALDPAQTDHAYAVLQTFMDQIVSSDIPAGADLVSLVVSKIADLDEQMSNQLNLIMHHPDFLQLEGAWRGVNYLVMNTHTSADLRLRLLCATKTELLQDLQRAVEFDQSQLFKKVYEAEYGTFGGSPFSCLIGSYEFGPLPQDMELLEKISGVAAASFAPFIAAAAPSMFGLQSFTDIGAPRDLGSLFQSVDFAKWNSFREADDSRYVVLTLPRVLMRLPYGPETNPVNGINFVEDVDPNNNNTFCWGSAAFTFGQCITNAFSLYSWTAAIRGVEGGGLVEDLPVYTYQSALGDTAIKCPTEVAITDRREKELSDLGFLALCYCKGTDKAAFFSSQTTQKPQLYNTPEANANAQLSARITYMLAACRFAHYIKSMMRDKVGSFMSQDNVQEFLQSWISNYVLLNDSAPEAVKATYPLREARVDVFDVPGAPGHYKATVFLRPHFQLEELTASLRLVATLPPPVGGS